MSAKYEATSPITLIAGETVSGVQDLLCIVNGSGHAVRPADSDEDAPVIGTFAQDDITTGEPVTINQLQGKIRMIAAAAVTAGHVAHASSTAAKRGMIDSSADFNATATNVGVVVEAASAGKPCQVLAIPYGTVGQQLIYEFTASHNT